MKSRIRDVLLQIGLARRIWSSVRACQLQNSYARRRRRYFRKKVIAECRPSFSISVDKTIHTYAIFPSWSWHTNLLPELAALGKVTHFDYGAGLREQDMLRPSGSFLEWRNNINSKIVSHFNETHSRSPVSWIFAYVTGTFILPSTIEEIRRISGVPAVNMCLDDKHSWEGRKIGGHESGSKGLVRAFDLWWTSASVCVDWVNAEGGRGIYLPEGCTPSIFAGQELPYSIPVSFIGGAYGRRPMMVRYLRRHGINVQTFGPGWKRESAISMERVAHIYRISQIVLGHGGIGYSENITNVKGRDFEVTCTGGGAYLTTFNSDLAGQFIIGDEILCWHAYDELLEQICSYLDRPESCRRIARAAKTRCLNEHRWLHRFQTVLRALNVVGVG